MGLGERVGVWGEHLISVSGYETHTEKKSTRSQLPRRHLINCDDFEPKGENLPLKEIEICCR